MPPRIAAAAWCGVPFANASGITPRNAAPSSAPIAYETSIGTHVERSLSANAARPAESVPPAKLAARIQPSVIGGGILRREPDERCHALLGLVPAIGEEPLRVGVSAEIAAVDAFDSLQSLPGDGIEVEQPVARTGRREGRLEAGERGAHVFADLVDLRPDRRAEPADGLRGIELRECRF